MMKHPNANAVAHQWEWPDTLSGYTRFLLSSAFLTLIFIALYFSELSVFSLSIDDEFAAFRSNAAGWVTQGRWTVYLIESFILENPTVPYLPTLLFGVFGAWGYIWILRAHGIEYLRTEQYLLFPIFISFPTWFFIAEFYANLPGIAVGILAVSVGLYCYSRMLRSPSADRARMAVPWYFISAISLFAIAIGAYQSFLTFALAAGCGIILVNVLTGCKDVHGTLVSLAILGATCLASLVLYYAVLYGFLTFLDLQMSPYMDGFVRPQTILQSPLQVIGRAWVEARRIYGGSAKVYGQAASVFGLIVIGGIICATVRDGGRSVIDGARRLGLILMVIAAPFAMHLISGGVMPYRAMIGVPYVMWLCAALIVSWRSSLMRAFGVILVAGAIFESLCTSSLFQADNQLLRDHDRLVAQQIYSRILDVNPNFDVSRTYKMEVFGALPFKGPYPKVQSSTVGASFFEWDGGNPSRIASFMTLLGLGNFEGVGLADRQKLVQTFLAMPSWPTPESVKVVGDVTLIKLGNQPGLLHQEVLSATAFLPSDDQILYRLSDGIAPTVKNAEFIKTADTLLLQAGNDPQLVLSLSPERMRRCRVLQIQVAQTIDAPSSLQVFYLSSAEQEFSGKFESAARLAPGAGNVSVFLTSDIGFAPMLRVDPIDNAQTVEFDNLKVGCVQWRQ